jgi:hypothetical protein
MGGSGPVEEAVSGFHLQRDESSEASIAGRDENGRLHLRVSES